MPIIASAKKKLRKDKKRTVHNRKLKQALKEIVKEALKLKTKSDLVKTAESFKKAQSQIDKAAKVHLIHKNKAARLKSRLAKKYRQLTGDLKFQKGKIGKRPQKLQKKINPHQSHHP